MITVKIHDVPITTKYEEMGLPNASPQVEYSLEMIRLTRYIKTAWSTSADLASQFIGSVQQPSALGDSFSYYLPHEYNAMSTPSMRAVSAGETPFGKSTAYSVGGELASYTQYDDTIMSVVYESVSDTSLQLLYDENFQSSVDFITIPGRKLFWNSDGATEPVGEDESAGIRYQRGEWSYTIKRIPFLRAAFWDHQGKVNKTAVESQKYDLRFLPGTLLFESAVPSNRTNYLGDIEFSAEARFAYNSLGWNKFPRAGKLKADGTFDLQKMYVSGPIEYKPYGEAELNDLLLTV